MTKFDFHKVEQTLGEALHHTFVKKLVSGEPISRPRAVSFFGVSTPKPNPQDSVIEALAEWQKEEAEEAAQESSLPIEPQEGPSISEPVSEIPFQSPTTPAVAPLYILRKRLLWFIKQRVTNVYKLLGTTKEEVIALRKKKEHSAEDEKRIQELVEKSTEIHQRLMKKLGLDTDDALIEKEKARHIRKRFNIKETWTPL